jgi:predicted transcriptional regulator
VLVPRNSADVTETELAILNVLWEHGNSEIRDIVERIYGDHSPALHATVKSLLDRLIEKGFVECDRSRFAHRFAAVIDREAYVGAQLQKLADSHFGGSLAPMLLALAERVQLSRKDRQQIQRIIDGIR